MIRQGEVPTSWNSTSSDWLHGGPLDSKTVPSANSTGDVCDQINPDREVVFDGEELHTVLQRRADVPYSSMTFGLRAGDESDLLQWMRAYADSFTMTVNYTPVVAVPTGLVIDGVGCLAPAGSRVTGTAPVLAGVPRNSEGTVEAQFEVRTGDGEEAVRSWSAPEGSSDEQVSWQVDPPLPDGAYLWRMRSDRPGGDTASDWSGWCEFTVDSALDAEPDPEAAEPLECPVADGDPLEAADESIALLLAQACEAPAEVTSERDFDVRVMAQPEGMLVAEQFTQPQWAHDADGEWVEADPSFETAADGGISTTAAVSEIEVSDGGDGPLLTATDPEGGSVSLTWPGSLPEPVIEGEVVTYPEVLPDVDLQVSAGVDGFSYVLVVKSTSAATSPELDRVSVGIEADGLDLVQADDGTVEVRDAAGEAVFSAPAAYMWDSSEPVDDGGEPSALQDDEEGSGEDDGTPGRFAEMPLDLDGAAGSLAVVPDEALLEDPEAEFPIVIDPPFVGKRMHWATVHKAQPGRSWTDDSKWPRDVGLRIGNLQNWDRPPWCGRSCGLWRSAVRFNIKQLSGRQIISAAVKATQVHTSGCDSYGLQLWYLTAFKSGASWNSLSDNWQNRLQSKSVASSNRTGGCGGSTPARGVTFGNSAVKDRVQSHANAGHKSLSFGFRSSNESSKAAYRRLALKSVKLEVEYNRPARKPTNLNTDGRGCAKSGPGPWLTTQRPTLSGKPRDPDKRVGAHLQIRRVGSSKTVYAWKSATNRKHNTVVNHRVRYDKRLSSGNYRWRMRSLDSHPKGTNSGWNQWCHFRVDVTSPTTPTVEILGDPPQAGEQVTLRFRSSDKHSGLDGFAYGINEEVKREFKSSSGTTEITFTTPETGGRNWIYVWSKDKAGNYSNRGLFDFFSARFVEATPAAAWRLDGDGVDDAGQGHELLLGNGVAWEDDAGPPADRSLGFDGTGCVATDAPVVRTDAEYTVAAWVRLDDKSRRQTIMGAAGNVRMGFYLRYREGDDRWQFLLGDEDTRESAWASVRSAQPPTVGEWTHIAVRVDPAARHLQMYVNGALSNERTIPWAPWNAEGPMQIGCSGRNSGYTWDHFSGAVHHAGVWQGLLTPDQIQAAYTGELPAGLSGDWPLRADGADGSAHARELTVPTTGVRWVDDQYGRQRSAMQLDGTEGSWAESAGPIVDTDRSFTVGGWAKLDDKSDFRTIASQGGVEVTTFNLNYQPYADRWQFSMSSHDDPDTVQWHLARSTSAPEVGRWYHLVGVFDQHTGQLRLYVDGQLQGTSSGPDVPWKSQTPLLVGTGGNGSGERSNRMIGTVSDVKTWRGALTADQAAEAYGGNPAVESLSQWSLNGTGSDDIGDHPLTVAGTEGADYDWVDDRACLPWRALGLQVSGQAYAHTAGPVLVTDESYTVATWVKLDALTGEYQTVLAQAGTGRSAFYLQVTPDASWRLAMPEVQSGDTGWAAAGTVAGTAEVGVWTHLAGVFDLAAGEVRLYVNGELAGVAEGVGSPWLADGPFYIGAGGVPDGVAYQPLHGAIDGVMAFSSTLDPDRIEELGRPVLGGGLCS